MFSACVIDMSGFFQWLVRATKEIGSITAAKARAAANTVRETRDRARDAGGIFYDPKVFAGLELLFGLTLFIIIQVYDPFGLANNYPGLLAAFILILTFYMVGAYYFVHIRAINPQVIGNTSLRAVFGKMTFLVGAIVIFALFGLGFGWFSMHVPTVATVVKYCLLLVIVAISIGIIYLLSKPLLGASFPERSKLGAARSVVLYVPCLFVEAAESLRTQWQITPKPVWILLAAEIGLIATLYLGPKLYRFIIDLWGTKLLRGPVYLSEVRTLGTFEQLHPEASDDNPNFNYNYALSAWFSINPQPPNTRPAITKDTTILSYGGKPNITYNGLDERLRIFADTGGGPVLVAEVTDLPLQKWNNIVVNYVGGTMDVFLNGDLIGSRGGIAPYMTFESVQAGVDDGIEGGLCNVVYFSRPLSLAEVRTSYNILKGSSPPVL